MKNPQPISTPFWLSRDLGDSALSAAILPTLVAPVGSATQQLMLKGAQGLQLLDKKDSKDEEPSTLASVLKFLKYTPDQIKRMEKFIGTLEKVAGTVVWVVGAVSTVKDLLTLAGVLGEDDESRKLLDQIAQTVQTIYSYLEETDKKAQYELALNWRSKVQTTKNEMHNLALSRTQSNLDNLKKSCSDMMDQAIRPMLGLETGRIPFVRDTYKPKEERRGSGPLVYVNEMPTHWSDYAYSFWMQTTGGEPVNNGNSPDLGSWIWDPGFYIDVLIEAIGVRIAGLAALEPGFRSTAQDRPDLREIVSGLNAFIDKWEHSLLITNVVGPLDPMEDLWGDHAIYHPWAGYTALEKPGLPIGAIDPVTGIAAFDPFWNDGFNMHFVAEGGSLGHWALSNYDQVVNAAYTYRSSLLALVREQCGINRLRALRDSVAALIGPPSPSEFVILSNPTFSRSDITLSPTTDMSEAATDEEVDLGVIGYFAGKPDKKYKARRWYQASSKTFRIPMARRMDYSKIQLGYRLRFAVGHTSAFVSGDAPIDHSSVLTEFKKQEFPEETIPLFPTQPQTFDLQSDSAGVYDVLQSAPFSKHEEELFENTGSVPGKQRLYLNGRNGKVRARAHVTFEFDPHNPNSPFIGYANVTVETLDLEGHRDGFILDVDVYETVMLAPEDPPRDEQQERSAGLMRLHFAPSFLVVEPDYFTDREAGLQAMGKAMKSVSDQYVRSKLVVGPRDPIEKIKRVEQEHVQLVNAFAEYARHSPRLAERLRDQFAVPALELR